MTWAGAVLLLLPVGCLNPQEASDAQVSRTLHELLLPQRIEIVEPFTRVKSFDDDATPDGIELLLRAVNALDNPGLMIAGQVRIELYEYVPASAQSQGSLLENWQVDLTTRSQQLAFWNQLTQMYQFRLAIDPARIPQARKFVLLVTYRSPDGETLTDEYVLQYQEGSGGRVTGR